MRALKTRAVSLEGTRLAPYEPSFVPAYNAAMKSPELLELTGSEPLSLEEEHSMQQRWMADEAMLCLLVLDADGNFVGDVNAHLNSDTSTAEVDIMICDPAHRRHGHARRALEMLFELLRETKSIETLEAKIKFGNDASIGLFVNKLGFVKQSESEIFQEVTLTRAL